MIDNEISFTLARASRAASASAAIARCSCTGNRTSFLPTRTMHATRAATAGMADRGVTRAQIYTTSGAGYPIRGRIPAPV